MPCEKNMNAGSLKPGSGLTETPGKETESIIAPTKPQKETPQFVDIVVRSRQDNIQKVTPQDKNGQPVAVKIIFTEVNEHETKVEFIPPVKALRIVVEFKTPGNNRVVSSLVCIKDEGIVIQIRITVLKF